MKRYIVTQKVLMYKEVDAKSKEDAIEIVRDEGEIYMNIEYLTEMKAKLLKKSLQ